MMPANSTSPVIISRYADVLEVLRRDEIFSVRLYAAKMERVAPTGFLLGMPDSPRYQQELALLHLAMRRDDLPRVRRFAAQTAHRIMRLAAPARRLDVVQELARVAPLRFVEYYLGVPDDSGRQLSVWAQALFQDIFLNLENDENVQRKAEQSGYELRAYLDDVIERRIAQCEQGACGPDDVLGRLLRQRCQASASFNRAQIRDNLIGLIVGAIDTTAIAITNVVDELLNRPAELQQAQQSACCEFAGASGDALLMDYIDEALRFKPQAPVLVRFCEHRYTIAATGRGPTIEPGTIVFAAIAAAMKDPAQFEKPQEFRRRTAADYLHFGHGLHACLGRYMASALILETVKRLLQAQGLRRVRGADGSLHHNGPFPQSMIVEFDSAHCAPP
jgi:cytochrome P450